MQHELVLHEHGLNAQSATTEEQTLALEVVTLRRLLGHDPAAHDTRTLRHIQEQRRKVVDAVLAWMDDDTKLTEVIMAGREFRRITRGEP
jgi:hypothetical protein